MPKLLQQTAECVTQVRQKTAAAPAGAGDDVDPRHSITQSQARLRHGPIDEVGQGCLLQRPFQLGRHAQIVVGERQPAQCP